MPVVRLASCKPNTTARGLARATLIPECDALPGSGGCHVSALGRRVDKGRSSCLIGPRLLQDHRHWHLEDLFFLASSSSSPCWHSSGEASCDVGFLSQQRRSP